MGALPAGLLRLHIQHEIKGSSASFAVCLNKSLNGAVVGPLDISRKETSWHLTCLLVISQAFTADAFSGTWFIGTVAPGFVCLDFTFSHGNSFRKSQPLPSLVEPAAEQKRGDGDSLNFDSPAGNTPAPAIAHHPLHGILLRITVAAVYL